MNHEINKTVPFMPRIVEDRMMAAWREAAQAGREAKEDARHRRQILQARRREKAAARAPAPRPVRDPSEPLAPPNGRRVPIWERKQERLPEDGQFFAARSREIAENKHRRLSEGFIQYGNLELSGVTVSGVSEMGLRSVEYRGQTSKCLERFPSLVPRLSRMEVADSNGALERPVAKLFGLDRPYVRGNTDMLGFLRIDCDRDFDSPEAAAYAFREVAERGDVACPPNLLVGLGTRDGRFLRPHAIWLLPYASDKTPNKIGAVLNKPSAAGFRRRPVDLFRAVYYGLVKAHMELGADANAPAMTQRVKNPLSPFWTVVVLNDDFCPELGVHAEYLDLTQCKERLVRRSAQIQSGQDLPVSNGLFNLFQKVAYAQLSAWHFDGDKTYRADRRAGRTGAIADRLHSVLEAVDLGSAAHDKKGRKVPQKQISLIAAKVADYASMSWDPERVKSRANRGVLMHDVEGLSSLRERQAVGGAHAARAKKQAADKRLLAAVETMMAEGQKITKTAVTRVSGLSYKTVSSKWAMVEERLTQLGNQCIVKKKPDRAYPPSSSHKPLPNPIPVARIQGAGAVPIWILDAEGGYGSRPLHGPQDELFRPEGHMPDPDAPEDAYEENAA